MYNLVIYVCIGIALIGSTLQFEEDGRIVGGAPVDIKDIPYQLSIRREDTNKHFCGASIMSAKWAVSAAHCFKIRTTGLILVAGTSLQSKGGSVHPIKKVIIHPSFDSKYNNDVAVLQVGKPFTLGSIGVKCISLASSPPAVGVLAQTSGWGFTKEGGPAADQLQRVLVPIIDNKACSKVYPITEQMICAGYNEGGKDACQFDSGGPLVVNNTLIGIVSVGKGCARPGYPGVYARVDKLYSWIKKVTGVSQC